MEIILSQPFIKVTRTIESNRQHVIEQQEMLNLYEDKIVAATQQFYLTDVFDVSYKSLSQNYWFLYLHTNQGVFPYVVKSEPEQFIYEFKKLK